MKQKLIFSNKIEYIAGKTDFVKNVKIICLEKKIM